MKKLFFVFAFAFLALATLAAFAALATPVSAACTSCTSCGAATSAGAAATPCIVNDAATTSSGSVSASGAGSTGSVSSTSDASNAGGAGGTSSGSTGVAVSEAKVVNVGGKTVVAVPADALEVEAGKNVVPISESSTTVISAQATKPVLVNGQELSVVSTQGGGAAGGAAPITSTQTQAASAPVIEVSVVETPPLPPQAATILPAVTATPVQAVPIEQPRATPPLNVGHLGPWHSMWSEGCVASMPAPLNRVTYVYRQVRKCADGSFLDEKANQLMFLHGGYCNFECANRFYEQCIADGSFDAYYVEQCPEIPIPTPGLAPTETSAPVAATQAQPIAVDANSRVYNDGCQAALPEPFNKVLRVEREVRSCADDSLAQKQTILTKGNYCTFDCVDLKSETCAADAAGASGVYIKENCFTTEAATDAGLVSTEQAQQARAILKKIRIQRLAPADTAAADAAPAIQISSADVAATTNLDVVVKDQTLNVKAVDAPVEAAKPVAVMPDEVKDAVVAQSGVAPATVSRMELKVYQDEAVYEVDAAKDAKLLGFIPVSMPVTTTISAEDASVVKEERPWWNAISTS